MNDAHIWLQRDSDRSTPHVSVTQVIKVTCLQKIRVWHWGFLLALLVYQSVVITALQAFLVCFLLHRFIYFLKLKWDKCGVEGVSMQFSHDQHLWDAAIVYSTGSFIFFSSSHLSPPCNSLLSLGILIYWIIYVLFLLHPAFLKLQYLCGLKLFGGQLLCWSLL